MVSRITFWALICRVSKFQELDLWTLWSSAPIDESHINSCGGKVMVSSHICLPSTVKSLFNFCWGTRFFINLVDVLESRNLQSIKPCLFDIIQVIGQYTKHIVYVCTRETPEFTYYKTDFTKYNCKKEMNFQLWHTTVFWIYCSCIQISVTHHILQNINYQIESE